MHHTDKYSQHRPIVYSIPVAFYLNFKHCGCFEQGVLQHSDNCRVEIYSERPYDMMKRHINYGFMSMR